MIPVENPDGRGTEGTTYTAWRVLHPSRTAVLLRDAPRILGASCEEILLAASLAALHDWSGARRIRVDVERHGREPVGDGPDPIRAVGWFTAIFPVDVKGFGRSAEDLLPNVSAALRAVPHRGSRYCALRYLADGEVAARLAELEEAAVAFNYLGRRGATAASVPSASPQARRL